MTNPPDLDQIRRLELLEAYDILNTPPEPEFDDIVLVASEVCGTPVSLVSLVEANRQWFKASVGFEPCETPIEQSVCAHSLASPDLLIIPDLTLDPRTAQNTLVTEPPHIRFYAGAPLIGPDGVAIGTLCVIDTKPRPQGLTPSQQKVLAALSRQVIALLEHRRTSHRKDELFRRQKGMAANFRATVNKTIAAQEAGRIGTFEIDIVTDVIAASAEFCRIFDVPAVPTYPAKTFQDMVVPSDRGLHSTDRNRSDGSASMNVEYRIRTASHGVRWISRHAVLEQDETGRPVKMIGTVQDITDAKRTVLRTQALLDLGDRLRDLDDITDMALVASDLMGKAFDATRAGFGLVDKAAETLTIQSEWHSVEADALALKHHFRSYGSYIEDLKRGEPVVLSDVKADPRTSGTANALLALGIRSFVNLPVLDHGRFNLLVYVHHDHVYDWTDEEVAFIRSFGDRVQMAMAKLQAETEQATLNREIGHRLKNTFAMIQAIATQTLRPVTERGHVQNFEKRLFALSKAHDILIHDQGNASIRNIVESLDETLAMPGRIDLDGPDVVLGPRGALSMGLVMHELGTNAMKYGALSQPDGIITIRWVIDESGPEPQLTFFWQESGGPLPKPPERKGFGSKLIQMGLIGTGGVVTSYEAPGFSVEMSASLQQLQQAN
ncbi:GAF domain-containing protein [Aliirhizobium smilacinae]|uniref:GAF domain-containing protein n=1 Tax=Aliirhizobium smilacinae TaxID=1395944 RepID=UPI001FE59B3D|nr:GAF domain-containing protein [Rhizobium smilacinae]